MQDPKTIIVFWAIFLIFAGAIIVPAVRKANWLRDTDEPLGEEGHVTY